MKKLLAHLLILLIWPMMLAAQPKLDLPIQCTLDEDCFIQQFMDRDPGSGATDFMCGTLTYDGHSGTDFALHSLKAQADGVKVLAAAAGTVRGVRDEMPDIMMGQPDAPHLKGRDCGNGVVIDHGAGWETQYCHLALGSVAVAAGDQVSAGDVLGLVGLSGRTQFPHVHLSLRQNGENVDPFERDGDPSCGADIDQSIWREPVPTPSGGIITLGFSDKVPEYADVKKGSAGRDQLAANGPALVLWVYMFGSQAGDEVAMSIVAPNGQELYADTFLLERSQAQLFRAGGRKTPKQGWPTGTHTGVVALLRNGVEIDRQSLTVDVSKP